MEVHMEVNQVATFTTTACATNASKKVIMPKVVHRSTFHRLHGRQDSRGAQPNPESHDRGK